MPAVPSGLDLPQHISAAVATQPEAHLLSLDERARMEAFRSAERRHAFALGRTAARRLLATRLGLDPDAVPLIVAADGAPTVRGASVSIAHTGRGTGAIGVAAVSGVPVGIDVERVAPRRADLWRRILAPGEYGLLDRLGGPTDAVQTLLWSLKESVLKGQRTGFRAAAQSVVLTLGDAGRASAESATSGAWEIAYAPLGDTWLVVAWADQGHEN